MDMNIIAYIAIILLFLICIFNVVQLILLNNKINSIFGKKTKKDIDSLLEKYTKDVKKYFNDVEELKKFSEKLFFMSNLSLQKVGLVRYNPFGDVGGDQSFSIALLNFENSGVIITSLFGRDGTRVYSKEVKKGKTEHHLSSEESQVLEKAIKNYK